MYKRIRTLIFLLLAALVMTSNTLNAEHLLGGEMTYECLGGDLFNIKLELYRDCTCPPGSNCADYFDQQIFLYFADETGDWIEISTLDNTAYQSIEFDESTDETAVGIEIDEAICPNELSDFCVKKGVYETLVSLPARENGYSVVFQRCCRNSDTKNLAFPEETGATFILHIPHESASECNNNSAFFNEPPPTYVCVNEAFSFDFSATDVDGDSLVYQLCTPFDGSNYDCPFIQPITPIPTCEFGPYPYDYLPIEYAHPFTFDNPLNGTDSLSILTIDANNGNIKGTAQVAGRFVVGVSVSEYRDGVLIGTITRDFQIHAVLCEVEGVCDCVKAIPDSKAQLTSNNDYQASLKDSLTYAFDNTSINAEEYLWDFGEGEGATSTEESPSWTYTDFGTYEVMLVAINGDCRDTSFLYLNLEESPMLAIERREVPKSFKPFPNPASTSLSFDLQDLSDASSGELKIYSAAGELIELIKLSAPFAQIQLDLSAFVNGLYFYQVKCEEFSSTGKFVVRK